MKWFYKINNGTISKLRKETDMRGQTEEQLIANGFIKVDSNIAMYNVLKNLKIANFEQFTNTYGITITNEEKTLLDHSFDKGDIRRACRSIIITPAIEADLNANPPIEAVPAITLEKWLNETIASSPENEKDWRDEKLINIDDPRVINALAQSQIPVTIDDIKKAIAKDRRVWSTN